MSNVTAWAVYYTVATQETVPAADGSSTSVSRAAGYVWNRVLWDGATEWSAPSGSASVSDPEGKYPIGSQYAA
ncbi:hypothetical protein [Asaia krungthepensis]|uniref:Uncharacterized protein n=1 Tax=Asaia krungthepensis NRIC 0535 TaxID=1307925 RepID=A0ABQ0Q2Y8_9PROT|nr:hypothetical protein [Asaia krungthepensis]GBQ88894.1 hypothetical protein AA0535_1654 [Asaia krungthepensis NRIC 0535]